MALCYVCGCRVMDVEEGELGHDMFYCEACSPVITCGVYSDHVTWQDKQYKYMRNVFDKQEKRYNKIEGR
jgi:hypothetical protein